MATTTKKKPVQPRGIKGSDPNLQPRLEAIGINCSIDQTVPQDEITPMFLELDDERRHLTVEIGSADVTFYLDRKFHQAVIVTRENTREITREFEVTMRQGRMTPSEAQEYTRHMLERGDYFPVAISTAHEDRPSYSVEELERVKVGDAETGKAVEDFRMEQGVYRVTYKAKVTADIPESESCFLVGRDEETMFISCLPKTVTSVPAAHEALRPKGVPKDAERVGEFFLVRVSAELNNSLDEEYVDSYNEPEPLDESENHMAAMSIRRQNPDERSIIQVQYVCGMIWDTQKRHKPLWLNEWHRVVRNAEIEPPSGVDGGSWD